MSKFLDRLDTIARGTTTPMGFGAASRVERLPSMGLLALISDKQNDGASNGADGVLIQGPIDDAQLKSLLEKLGDLPWGIEVNGLSESGAAGYLEQGADFFAFNANGVEVAALSEEEPGYLLSLPLDSEERTLRAIEDLPVDGVVLSIDSLQTPLDLSQLMALSSVRCMFNKYLLVQLPGVVSAGELQGLRDIGVDAVILDMSSINEEGLREFQDNLMNLPRQRKARSSKADAMLPRNAFRLPGVQRREEEDDDDEE